MNTKHQPATPLPWRILPTKKMLHLEARERTITSRKLDDIVRRDFLYAANAANAYPKLVEALREALLCLVMEGHHEGISKPVTDGRNLLRELGEIS